MSVPSTLFYVADDERVRVSPITRVASLPIAERVLRAAFRAGYTRAVVLDRTGVLATIGRAFGGTVQIAASNEAWQTAISDLPDQALVTAIGPGTIVSTALFKDALTVTPDVDDVIDVPAGRDWPESGVVRARVEATRDAPALAAALLSRTTADPSGDDVVNGVARLTVRVHHPADLPRAEHTLRRAVYKPTDAAVARFNRRISLPISMCLLRTPITANHISVALVAIGFWSAWLFSRGHYAAGLLGAFLSLAASVLDGCDGEIARLKYQESALGCWLETFGDYSYYLAIFAGLTIGAVRQTQSPVFLWLGAASLSGTLVSFVLLIYLRSRITAGQPETLHAVARSRFRADPSWWSIAVWRVSFVATRSTMPYGIMALALLNLLPLFVVLSAVGANIYWVSLVLKLRHLLGTEASEPVAA